MRSRRVHLPGLLAALAAIAAGNSQAQALDCQPGSDPDARKQAEQRIVLLARMVGDTKPVQRVMESGNAEAEQAIADARERVTMANAALEAGCDADAAGLASDGLALAASAFRIVKEGANGGDQEYRRLHERTQSFMQSLESQPDELRGVDEADLVGLRRQIQRAEEFAVGGDYAAASKLLVPVADRLERRLVAIYDQRTVYYEKNFAGPADEYAYLAEQFQGYRMLMVNLAGDRQPPHAGRQLFADTLAAAEALASEAAGHAEAEDWEPALAGMREAINNYERALRMIGIGY